MNGPKIISQINLPAVLHRTLATLLIMFMSWNISYAQEGGMKFKNLSVDDGLPQNWINKIYKDSFGYMWFGTNDNGLVRYDGYNFINYKRSPKNPGALSHNEVRVLYEDKKKNLWLGTLAGVNIFNRELDRFYSIKGLEHISVNNIYEHDEKRFVILSPTGIYVFQPDIHKLDSIAIPDSELIGFDFLTLNKDRYLASISRKGLYICDIQDLSLEKVKIAPKYQDLVESLSVIRMYKEKEGKIWMGTQEGLLLFEYQNPDFSHQVFTLFSNDPGDSTSIVDGLIVGLHYDKGNLWIREIKGAINVMNLNKPYSFRHFTRNTTDLKDQSFRSLYIDDIGTYWFGTANGGVFYYNDKLFVFDHINKQNNGLINNAVNTFYDEEDYLWVGTQGGLSVWDKKQQKWKHYQNDPFDPNSLSVNSVKAVCRDKNNIIWVGTWNGGLNKLNEEYDTFTCFKTDADNKNSISSDHISEMAFDKRGDLWISTMGGGVNKFDYSENIFKKIKLKSKSFDPGIWVNALMIDSRGNFWVVSNKGLVIFDEEENVYVDESREINNNIVIKSSHIISMYEDSKKNIWIGTENGLIRYRWENGFIPFYSKDDGLSSDIIQAITEDIEGNLWISTNKGITKFFDAVNQPEENIFINYNISDGLQGNDFISRSVAKGVDGKIYFGGTNGYNVFHPDSITDYRSDAKIIFTDLLVNNKPVEIGGENSPLKKHIRFVDEVILSYKESMFTIKYTAIDFLYQENISFGYKLEGFDKEWNYVGNIRQASYTNLDPGKYTFKVIFKDNKGTWNFTSGDELKIIITPPFWKTWIFKIIVVLIVMALILLIFSLRIRRVRLQNLELEKLVRKKTEDLSKINEELKQFAYIVSHDLKAPLRGITNLASWIEEDYSSGQKEEIFENISLMKKQTGKMDDLINGVLEYSRIGRMHCEKETINVKEQLDDIIQLLNIQGNFEIIFKGNFPRISFNKVLFDQVFNNLINNAMKYHHKGKGTITIGYEPKDTDHLFYVEDDGPGIAKEFQEKIFMIFQTLKADNTGKSTGVGLTIVKKIIEESDGKIWVESDGKSGSRFLFTIPKT